MKELSEKEKAYAALALLADSAPHTDAQRVRLVSDIHYYICELQDTLRILG
jgi:hypothetical protein